MTWGRFFKKTGPRRKRCSKTDQLFAPRPVSGRNYPIAMEFYTCMRRPLTANHLEPAPSELSFLGPLSAHQARDGFWSSVL